MRKCVVFLQWKFPFGCRLYRWRMTFDVCADCNVVTICSSWNTYHDDRIKIHWNTLFSLFICSESHDAPFHRFIDTHYIQREANDVRLSESDSNHLWCRRCHHDRIVIRHDRPDKRPYRHNGFFAAKHFLQKSIEGHGYPSPATTACARTTGIFHVSSDLVLRRFLQNSTTSINCKYLSEAILARYTLIGIDPKQKNSHFLRLPC